MSEKIKPVHILLADDDADDIEFFEEAVNQIELPIKLNAVFDGQQVLEFLEETKSSPDFIFLDLNMPRMNGLECLQNIRKSEKLCHLQVIIYSTSNSDTEIDLAMENGASLYLIKTHSIPQLATKLESLLLNKRNGQGKNQKENFVF